MWRVHFVGDRLENNLTENIHAQSITCDMLHTRIQNSMN